MKVKNYSKIRNLKKEIINKTLILFIASALILNNLTIIKTNALDAVLHDPDVLDVTSPGPNSKVKGTINIVWKMFDNDQNVIPYTANLYDAQTCNVTNYGQINSNPNGVSSLTQNNTLSWNTRTTLSNPNINDGTYCLKICAALKNGPTPYSACNGRNVTIINNNRLPIITSVPSNLIIFENQNWSYQINAYDPDGDPLQYRFVVKPAFLDINSQTGLITSNSANKLPPNSNSATYTIVIAVDDNFSGSVTQQFDLTIKKVPAQTPPPPPSTPGTPPAPPPTSPSEPGEEEEPEENYPTTIKFISPTTDSVFRNDANIVRWEVSDENGIEKIVLQYSSNTVIWTDLIEITDPEIAQYNWNVSEIENGEYLLRLVVTDSLGSETSKTSSKFLISNEEETPVESIPLIINTSPINNSEISERQPQITGEFIPSEGAVIDPETFQITLDGVDITEQCVADESGFACATNQDLAVGLHSVEVLIRDSNERAATVEWTFTIAGDSEPTSFPEDSVNIFGNAIPRNTAVLIAIICCLAFLLLLIPWLLYVLWSRRRDTGETTVTTTTTTETQVPELNTTYDYYVPPFDTTYQTGTSQPAPEVTTNYYYPENYTYSTGIENTFSTEKTPAPEFTYPETSQTTTTTQTTAQENTTQAEPNTSGSVSPSQTTTTQTTTTTSTANTSPPQAVDNQTSNQRAQTQNQGQNSSQNGYIEPTVVD